MKDLEAARKAEQEAKAALDMSSSSDELSQQLGGGDAKAIQAAREAQRAARAKMREKLWKVYGPQNIQH